MKVAWLLAVALVLGTTAGIGTAVVRWRLVPWNNTTASQVEAVVRFQEERQAARAAKMAVPNVEVDQAKHDFGTLDVETVGRHEFVLTNRGSRPAKLSKGTVTCSCVLSELAQTELAPGESTRVILEWRSKGRIGPYRQSGTIRVDPGDREIILSVEGRFVSIAYADPAYVDFGKISTSEPAASAVRFYSLLDEPITVAGYDYSDPATAKHFDINTTPLPAAQLQGEKGAKSGLAARITLKPGLPCGPIRQTITFQTNLKQRPAITVQVQGTVTSDITVVGRGWNEEAGRLSLGAVKSQEGTQRVVVLSARGPYRKDVHFKLVSVSPAFLKARLEEIAPGPNPTAVHTKLTIEVPKGQPSGSYIEAPESRLGEIVLRTNHPYLPELKIPIAFIVEE